MFKLFHLNKALNLRYQRKIVFINKLIVYYLARYFLSLLFALPFFALLLLLYEYNSTRTKRENIENWKVWKNAVQEKMTKLLTIMNPRGCPLTFLNVLTFFSTFKFNFGLSGERDLSILSFKLQVLFIAGKDCLFSCQSFVIL